MITEENEYYISENNLNTHYFVFDYPFITEFTEPTSRWFICNSCKIELQLYDNLLQTFKRNNNFSCEEMIIKRIIE